MVIDLDKCTACQACTVACQAENNVPITGPEEFDQARTIFFTEVFREIEGEFPFVEADYVPRPCLHCENAPCVRVCPVAATFHNENGAVVIDYDTCIGCRFCTVACPYTARSFNYAAPDFPTPLDQALNPDLPVRPKGVAEKCTFCFHRVDKLVAQAAADDRELTNSELTLLPACNQACPASARYFGDLDDPNSTVSHLTRSPRAFRLLEDLGTEATVTFLTE
jgi:molybdopterin-containing oxidoreductase family iron-sulfur binding subunit